jgi:hypothetical protein
MRNSARTGLIATAAFAACAHPQIAGTNIDDTKDNRAIIKVLATYKDGFERRDAEAVLKLVSPKFYETNGTADPSDDYDFNGLTKTLGDQFKQVSFPSLDLDVRRIDVATDDATVNVFFASRYQLADAGPNSGFKTSSDVSQIHLHRESGDWKITSGI